MVLRYKEIEYLQTLKDKLDKYPTLWCSDGTRTFQLYIDCNVFGLDVCLTKNDDEGQVYLVAYTSCSNNKIEALLIVGLPFLP